MERNVQMHFRVNEDEEKIIKKKMEELGIVSIGSYLRKMAMDGYCIQLDMTDMKEAIRLLRICSNNLNQYAKRANETNHIYLEDIKGLQDSLERSWELLNRILTELSKLR